VTFLKHVSKVLKDRAWVMAKGREINAVELTKVNYNPAGYFNLEIQYKLHNCKIDNACGRV
jgi:hypothetical protein